MKSFLRVFRNVIHALEAAATIAAPIVKAVSPEIGGLMTQATSTAVAVEAAITTPGSGAQKAAIVSETTANTIALINSLLVAQGKTPLSLDIRGAIDATVKNVVDGLNTAANMVDPVPAK